MAEKAVTLLAVARRPVVAGVFAWGGRRIDKRAWPAWQLRPAAAAGGLPGAGAVAGLIQLCLARVRLPVAGASDDGGDGVPGDLRGSAATGAGRGGSSGRVLADPRGRRGARGGPGPAAGSRAAR